MSLFNTGDRKLRIHIRRLAPLAYNPYDQIRAAQQVFATVGIAVDVCSIESLQVPKRDLSRFQTIQGPYDWDTTDGRRDEMYTHYGVQDWTSIMVFLVATITPVLNKDHSLTHLLGVASSPAQRPTVYLHCTAAPWVLAHELGHWLLPPPSALHSADPNNLMFRTASWAPAIPTISPEQAATMRRSALLVQC